MIKRPETLAIGIAYLAVIIIGAGIFLAYMMHKSQKGDDK